MLAVSGGMIFVSLEALGFKILGIHIYVRVFFGNF